MSRFGAFVQINAKTGIRGSLTVRTSELSGNCAAGAGADLTVENTYVHGTRGPIGLGGAGIGVNNVDGTHTRGTLTVRSCLVDDAEVAGIAVGASDATVTGTVVRNTLTPGLAATGVFLYSDPAIGERGNLTMTSCLLEKNHGIGVVVQGADLVFESSESSRNLPRDGDGFFGRGMQVQLDDKAEPKLASTVTVHASLFQDNYEEGIMLAGATGIIDHVVVKGTKKGSIDGQLGDGIAVFAADPSVTTSAQISSVELSGNARAGVASFAAPVGLRDASLQCNALDLSSDAVDGRPASFDDKGGNQCGCAAKAKACVALSANLIPPDAPAHMMGANP